MSVYERFGKVDVPVNNAGMWPLYDRLVAVNLKGPFRPTALGGTRMAASGRDSLSLINESATGHDSTRPRCKTGA